MFDLRRALYPDIVYKKLHLFLNLKPTDRASSGVGWNNVSNYTRDLFSSRYHDILWDQIFDAFKLSSRFTFQNKLAALSWSLVIIVHHSSNSTYFEVNCQLTRAIL